MPITLRSSAAAGEGLFLTCTDHKNDRQPRCVLLRPERTAGHPVTATRWVTPAVPYARPLSVLHAVNPTRRLAEASTHFRRLLQHVNGALRGRLPAGAFWRPNKLSQRPVDAPRFVKVMATIVNEDLSHIKTDAACANDGNGIAQLFVSPLSTSTSLTTRASSPAPGTFQARGVTPVANTTSSYASNSPA